MRRARFDHESAVPTAAEGRPWPHHHRAQMSGPGSIDCRPHLDSFTGSDRTRYAAMTLSRRRSSSLPSPLTQ